MSRITTNSNTLFGCSLPPGWLIIDGISTQRSSGFSGTLAQLRIADRDHGLEFEALAGNDPKINAEQYAGLAGGDFLFIGTSFLRSLLLCLQLATNSIDLGKKLPRLVVIDRNHFIISCWETLRAHLEEIMNGDFSKLYALKKSHLATYSDSNKKYTQFTEHELNDCIKNEINRMLPEIKKFRFDLIKAILDHSIIICADWSNTAVFEKIRALCEVNAISNVVMYPSNIVECTYDEPQTQKIILDNIQLLSPVLSIHTIANFSAEEVSRGIDYKHPSQCLYVERSVDATEIIDTIRRFSITRAHKGRMPIPEKMTAENTILRAATQLTLAK